MSQKIKNKNVAATIALLAGGLGIHKFYLGQTLWGWVYLVFFWTFIPSVVALVEFILYLFMSEEEFDAKYNKPTESAKPT